MNALFLQHFGPPNTSAADLPCLSNNALNLYVCEDVCISLRKFLNNKIAFDFHYSQKVRDIVKNSVDVIYTFSIQISR